MKRILLIALTALMASAAVNAKTKIVTDTLYSKVLKYNQPYSVCLPSTYSEQSEKSYPVLYLLHGLSGSNQSWRKSGKVNEIVDYLVASGMVDEMIIVMPNAGAFDELERSQHGYFNCPDWRYEDYFFQEFMPFVEGKYRIRAEKASRAIAGLSMGGGGTVAYAQKHPELFCAAYAMSAFVAVCKARPITSDMTNKKNLMRIYANENDCIKFVRDASDEVISKLKTVSWFVDCGDDDHLLEVNMEYVIAMKEAGIPLQFRVREGGHKWEYWRNALHICLPYLTREFNR